MPLSEQEQRLLDEMERHLMRNDADVVSALSELGLTGFQSNTDYALYAPARTPRDIVLRLNRETNAVLQQPDVRSKLAAQGIEVSGSTPEALHAELLEELSKWSKVISTAHIKPE